ncbi:hypothetical protein [Hephaestia mangrovi]|uniref:hypothetical protein n=1 Tax=Hephaestia mangrovi TaxID=2873268 RepID=UPI0021048998|nr:hypothetical protein [Hephaestia mangrovi]
MAIWRAAAMAAGMTIGGIIVAVPASAQNAVENGVLVIYGNQKCPTDSSGREIVVCKRRDADEQFRIPKELRQLEITPENESWTARSQDTLNAGTSGIGSCGVSGAGSDTGCFSKQAQAWRQEKKRREAEQADIP